MWPALALGGLTPLAIYDQRRRPLRETAQLFVSFIDQQLFESVEIVATCEGYPEWQALLSGANRAEVIACAGQFLSAIGGSSKSNRPSSDLSGSVRSVPGYVLSR